MHDTPLITIIVATLNSARRLPRCLSSISEQTYSSREVIVMDGGSTDGTVDLLRSAASVVTYWESSPDHGISHAWNKALPHARGEWICFLGADDYFWSSSALERISQILTRRSSDVLIVYGRIALVDQEGAILEIIGSPWDVRRASSLRALSLPHQAVFHHVSIFSDFGGFDESLRIAADYDLLVRVLRSAEAEFAPETITAMEVGGISSVTASELLFLRERARVWQKNGLARRPPLTWWWTYGKAHARVVFRRTLGDTAANRLFDAYRQLTGRPKYWTGR
jgi:glycosyltransferase involved in cell wall biosynthesis